MLPKGGRAPAGRAAGSASFVVCPRLLLNSFRSSSCYMQGPGGCGQHPRCPASVALSGPERSTFTSSMTSIAREKGAWEAAACSTPAAPLACRLSSWPRHSAAASCKINQQEGSNGAWCVRCTWPPPPTAAATATPHRHPDEFVSSSLLAASRTRTACGRDWQATSLRRCRS